MLFGKYATLTDPVHKTSYAAIDPARPALSQAGRTVLVTGGGTGIGSGIVRGFAGASAARIIVVSRRPAVVAAAARALAAEAGYGGEVRGVPCDMGDAAAVDALWDGLAAEGVVVDVLVLNAATFAPSKPLLDLGTAAVWEIFNNNVRAQMHFAERFYKQAGKGASETKYLVHVSTAAIHDFTIGHEYLGYGLTKNAGQLALQLIAQDTAPERMQFVGYHPGAILSEAALAVGCTEDTLPWDHVDLPGHFAVWAASPEAKFLHGRFVWAAWDVDQLKNGELRKRIDEEPAFLKIGVNGL
ncbi:putative short-chain dehydrogenase [Rosellinia necatrix]|uniref:Putative short-chain dehydrogenase n=1 Tax=Rosellinia necatrix TaxID=77044 RepID=A0A1W2TAZ8_ROSNE|nr:putative short-chain dehydrogenase [Rosellinia necatrix]